MKIGAEFGSGDASSVVCVVEIWNRSWLNSSEYTLRCEGKEPIKANHNTCTEIQRKKRHLAGGVRNVPVEDERVVQHLNDAVASIAGAGENGQFT